MRLHFTTRGARGTPADLLHISVEGPGAGFVVVGAQPTRIQILLYRLDAKRIGLALLHHIQAWEILTFKQRTAETFKPNTYYHAEPRTT